MAWIINFFNIRRKKVPKKPKNGYHVMMSVDYFVKAEDDVEALNLIKRDFLNNIPELKFKKYRPVDIQQVTWSVREASNFEEWLKEKGFTEET